MGGPLWECRKHHGETPQSDTGILPGQVTRLWPGRTSSAREDTHRGGCDDPSARRWQSNAPVAAVSTAFLEPGTTSQPERLGGARDRRRARKLVWLVRNSLDRLRPWTVEARGRDA